MSDWDDMMDMGYGNSDGTLTDSFYESCEEDESNWHSNIEYEYIKNVELTPSQHLSTNEKYIRAKITNNKELTDWSDFELMHEKSNNHDAMAIQVFYKEIFIGYIKKNNTFISSSEINFFCFNKNILYELQINWVNDSFQIRKVLTDEIKKYREKEKELEEEAKKQREIIEAKNQRSILIKSTNEKINKGHIESLEGFKRTLIMYREEFLVELAKKLDVHDSNIIKLIEMDIKILERQDYGVYDKSKIKVTYEFMTSFYDMIKADPSIYTKNRKKPKFLEDFFTIIFDKG